MSSPLLHSNQAVVVPIVGKAPLVIDLTHVYEIENRIEEVAFVTTAKAPELMARFNEAYLYVHKHISLLEYELNRAEREANKVRAIILLDKVSVILEQKGLLSGKSRAGSEDLRTAILDQDEEYQDALDQTQKIKCVIELLKGKLKGFEMAYTSTKKILGESSMNLINRTFGSGTGDAPVGGSNPEPIAMGFGKATYAGIKE
jgi:hypothetical protein